MPNNYYYGFIAQNAPFGYAYLQVIYSEAEKAVDCEFIEVNTAFEELTGLKKANIVGKTVTEVVPEIIADNFDWIKHFSNIAHKGSKVEFTKYLQVLQRWCKINVFSPDKEYLVMLINDVTKEKRAEKELMEKSTELERFFLLVPDLLCIADTDGYLHKINNAWRRLLDYSPEELLTNKYTKFVHPLDRRKTTVMYKKLARRKKVIDFVNRYRCADGSYRYLSWRATAHGKKVYAVARDITAIKAAKERIEASEELLKVTLHSIGDGVITTDPTGKILMLNATATELTGWQAKEAVGQHFSKVFNLLHETTRQNYLPTIEPVLKGTNKKELFKNTLLISKNRQESFVEGSAACIKNHHRDILGLVLVFRDVTEDRQRAMEITYLSYYDKLTGLYNRAFFEDQLRRLDQPRKFPLSLIMGDVNGLKLTNDVFGHKHGDQLLIEIANILKECCRAEDIVARWGGDEFVILLPQTSKQTAENICQRIKKACDEASNSIIQLSIALGCATKENTTENIMQVLKKAEDYMYKNKLLISKSLRSSIVASIQKTMYEKSHESEAHANRLGHQCKKVGYLLGLPENEINDLELLALLHDIGIVVVKDSILNKQGPLTEGEWLEIKKHPEVGYRIAQSVPELASIAEYILTHHERWDGQGYPQGLKGEDIPLLSRILSVVDAYDAMTHHRAHRPALTKNEAITELWANAGTQFDPDIVDIFVKEVLLD